MAEQGLTTQGLMHALTRALEPVVQELKTLNSGKAPSDTKVKNMLTHAQYQLLRGRVESYSRQQAGSVRDMYHEDVSYLLDLLKLNGLVED